MRDIKNTLLNFPPCMPKVRANDNGMEEIWDPIRKKYVKLTMEEWVRQHVIDFLVKQRGMPSSLIVVEGSVSVGKLKQRFDLVVYNRNLQPLLLVECKAPSVPISQKIFDQITRYNSSLDVPCLWVTNGLQHFCFQYDRTQQNYLFLEDIPSFLQLDALL